MRWKYYLAGFFVREQKRIRPEDLPFADSSFDLATVSRAFHWFGRARFLEETHRVLRPGGGLIIYDNFFRGEMRENPAFGRWFRDRNLSRYASRSRDARPFTDEEAEKYRFSFVGREEYENDVRFSVEELADNLVTQSNIIAVVEEDSESVEEVHGWLVGSLSPHFCEEVATFRFGGHIWYLRSSIH